MNSYKKSLMLKWNWPENCDRILLLKSWKLSEISSQENEDRIRLNASCYLVCYRAEYDLIGGFEYNLDSDDYGELMFYLVPLSMSIKDLKNEMIINLSGFDYCTAISAIGHMRQVKVKTHKSRIFNSPYYKIESTITCYGKGFDEGNLFYRIKGFQYLYKVPIKIEIGQNELPAVLSRGDFEIEFLYKQMEKMFVI